MLGRFADPPFPIGKVVRIAGLEPANWGFSLLLIAASLCTCLLLPILQNCLQIQAICAIMGIEVHKNVWEYLGTKVMFGKCLGRRKYGKMFGESLGLKSVLLSFSQEVL
jgi:hypothetical protein